MKFKKIANGIFVVEGFMTKEECSSWISFSEEQGYEEAGISRGNRQVSMRSIRNNERLIYDSHNLASELWDRIKPYVPEKIADNHAIGLNERFRFYKYFPGQQFKPHQDGSYIRSKKEFSAYTFMVYLNEEVEGGATRFLNCQIYPQMGKALIFKHDLVHEGCEVKSGVKYVLRTDIMYRRG